MTSDTGDSDLIKETVIISIAYVLAFAVTFKLLLPVQNIFFPKFPSYASLLFLPHGVRVLAAWLLGWRSVIALFPGVFFSFWYVAGMGVFEPSRLFAISVAVFIPAATFHTMRRLGVDLFPAAGKTPCWHCIVLTSITISALTASMTNIAITRTLNDLFAYLIGDFFGMFFLMTILMFFFRSLRQSEE
ncbi:hypothetical protein O2N63_13145 [Aliiroseovarius sp. KMU-50]|uniref:MASE1 domain-containing protein n=1 Tax=Aliiroseovarius salicola TaxID=3009082 RepID=A0ABT4W3N7_9RHOB|nr:hypothetical protein [Aliiroseovarius sp. KMU-50]MDA5095029.1 hypothetical protein [Aliiroseovarius sp. KMU-50]